MCVTGTKRLLSPPDNLMYGMGDIFVKLSLINNSDTFKNNIEDLVISGCRRCYLCRRCRQCRQCRQCRDY